MILALIMELEIQDIFFICFAVRILSLFKSISNEIQLKRNGAVEYGKSNSMVLTFSHVIFYVCCLLEAYEMDRVVNNITYLGIALYVFSMIALASVILSLGKFWTVKLYIAPDHKVNHSWLFRWFRHPNYFFNVIPELIGLALICQAYITLVAGLFMYSIPLYIRIRQEEAIMKQKFTDY